MRVLTNLEELSFNDHLLFKEYVESFVNDGLDKNIEVWEFLDLCDRFSKSIEKDHSEVASFLRKENLYQKLKAELGDDFERELRSKPRIAGVFEGYRPLGVLCHITPGNDDYVAFLASIEGLLTGNINLVKLPSDSQNISESLFKKFFKADENQILVGKLLVCAFSSRRTSMMDSFLAFSDGVSAWGGKKGFAI